MFKNTASIVASANQAHCGKVDHAYRNGGAAHYNARSLMARKGAFITYLMIPRIDNANLFGPEPGNIAYDGDSERLCYTDNNSMWRCLATVEEITDTSGQIAALAVPDIVSGLLAADLNINPASTTPIYPVDSDFYTITGYDVAAPRVSSPNFTPATGVYTSPVESTYLIYAQTSWKEGTSFGGGRVITRIIHTAFLGSVRTILIEATNQPTPNINIETVQSLQIAAKMLPGDTLHVEVAHTATTPKIVEGGLTGGSSATSLTIEQIAQPSIL